MKKLIVMSLAALFLASCGGSKKGAWSDEDKEKFQTKCKNELGSIAGEDTKGFCDCLTSKAEQEYDNFDEADKGMNTDAGAKIGLDCMSNLVKDTMKDLKIPETPAVDEEPIENPAAEEEMPEEELSEDL
ncbi:MAG: hypothetical protein FJX99_07815 [Bacteroidetes bacterium]|nr:hypothetical protein [Bacteroidota bacterium]